MDAGGLQPQGYNDVAEMELSRVHHGVSQLFFTVNHPFFTQKQVFISPQRGGQIDAGFDERTA